MTMPRLAPASCARPTRGASQKIRAVPLDHLVALLDGLLSPGNFQDRSNNGLQLANNSGKINRVVTGVDASLRLLREAAAQQAQCVVCHHGLSWGDSLSRITGLNRQIVSFALAHDIAIYASHLPLDAHPRLGNNAQLCRALGLTRPRPAFAYHGAVIGALATLPRALPFDSWCARVRKCVAPDIRVLPFGKPSIRTVGVVSGGASDMIEQAAALGADVFLTGEPSLQGYNVAETLGINVVFAGHYATETFGPRALAAWIARSRLALPAAFVDFKIPF